MSAKSARDFNEAVFAWCVRSARRCLGRGDLERTLRWSVLAAKSAIHHPFGGLVSAMLEETVVGVASRLPPPAAPGDRRQRARWLHVLDQAFSVGGHSMLAERWISLDPRDVEHRVLLLAQTGPVPRRLEAAAEATGGRVDRLEPGLSLAALATALRAAAWAEADAVVLYVHPHSVVAAAAFGVDGGPPVLHLNHQSQNFWVGASVADLVLNLRASAREWSERHRGIGRNALLPIPALPRADVGGDADARDRARQTARRALGLPAGAPILLTSGGRDKFYPMPGLDFLDAAGRILEADADTLIVAVGFDEDQRWRALRQRTGGRFLAAGPQPDPGAYHAAADVFLESFPVPSPTALLEVGLLGTPCVRAPRAVPPPFAMDGPAIDTVGRPADVAAYVREVVDLVKDPGERARRGAALAAAIRAHHSPSGWRRYLAEVCAAVPDTHRVSPPRGAVPLPEPVAAFVIAKSGAAHAHDTLEYTWRVAAEHGLSPHRMVDARLLARLVSWGAAGDRRRRRSARLTLLELATGRRLSNRLRDLKVSVRSWPRRPRR